jgi:thioredoxin-dependent peroxiredoxin
MRTGDVVEDFELPDQDGKPRRLSAFLAAGPVVLFFYPLAGSGGCTREVCHFRDLASDFRAVGAQAVGISRDPVDKQLDFARNTGAGFPLLSDADGDICDYFGVKRKMLAKVLPVKRSTFVIDAAGVLRDVINSETDMETHADEALATLKRLASPA